MSIYVIWYVVPHHDDHNHGFVLRHESQRLYITEGSQVSEKNSRLLSKLLPCIYFRSNSEKDDNKK